MTINPEDLKRWQALCDRDKQLGWVYDRYHEAEFFAVARTALPDLLSEVKRLTDWCASLKEENDEWDTNENGYDLVCDRLDELYEENTRLSLENGRLSLENEAMESLVLAVRQAVAQLENGGGVGHVIALLHDRITTLDERKIK